MLMSRKRHHSARLMGCPSCRQAASCVLAFEAVADAVDGADAHRRAGVLELAAQVAQVRVDGAVVDGAVALQRVEDLLAPHRIAARLDEQREDLELTLA